LTKISNRAQNIVTAMLSENTISTGGIILRAFGKFTP